ncbi:MAG: nucleotidyltransferase family protein, partial [Planctomycetes bacterium]|nr:nucleotidyltransferase family protein [Planctomycetota bacterium]
TVMQRLNVTSEQIAQFCRKHHIKRLIFFGSAVRDEMRPDSDVDVLYEFEAGHHPAWDVIYVADELSAMLGRKVDFVPYKGLRNPYLRSSIMRDHEVVYAA